ncbi:MAG: hypothetical protein AAB360_01940 [Patescibacteria group bacterium]
MFKKKDTSHQFYSVAMAIILAGAFIFTYGAVGWLWNVFGTSCSFVYPSEKIIGGLLVIALGYIQLELDLLRQKQI